MKQFLLLLFATLCGSGAALAETELLHPIGFKYQIQESSSDYLSYSALSGSGNTTTVASFNSEYESANNRYNYNIILNAPPGYYDCGYELFSYSREVPSYTRATVNMWTGIYMYNHALKTINATVPCASALYIYDTESEARSASLPSKAKAKSDYSNCDAIKNHLIKYVYNSGEKEYSYFGASFFTTYLDNSTGSSAATFSKYLVLTCCSNPSSGSQQGFLYMYKNSSGNFESISYDYYKTVSFNANGGKGSIMLDQSVVNSATLKTCAFSKDGKDFIGWNTKADGTGTSYADGATITATASSKGPVTLYAMWRDHVHTFADDDLAHGICTSCGHGFVRYEAYEQIPINAVGVFTFNSGDTGGYCNIISNTEESAGHYVIELHHSVNEIYASAFSGCEALKSITIPSSVSSIEANAFAGCTGLSAVYNYATTPQAYSNLFPNTAIPLYVPASAIEAYRSAAGWSAFTDIRAIRAGNDPVAETCTTHTFAADDSHRSVCITCGHGFLRYTGTGIVEPYNREAFYDSDEKVLSIVANRLDSDGTYYIEFNREVHEIGVEAFYGCTGLETITFPKTVNLILTRAFAGCSNLSSITVLATVPPSFDVNSSFPQTLSQAYVPASAIEGYKRVYDWQVQFTDIRAIPVTGHTHTFAADDSHRSVCTSCGHGFLRYSGTGIVVPNNREAFFGSDGKVLSIVDNRLDSDDTYYIELSEPVATIGLSAFQGCTGLTDITIPESVTIGYKAFYGCTGLTSLVIPATVSTIGHQAFYQCTGLTSITDYATTPQTYNNLFSNTSIPLYVQGKFIQSYKGHLDWGKFSDIRVIPGTEDNTSGTGGGSEIIPGSGGGSGDGIITTSCTTHTFAAEDVARSVCTVCGHGFLRYGSSGYVTPTNSEAFKDKDGKTLSIIQTGLHNDIIFFKNYIEFDKPLVTIGKRAFSISFHNNQNFSAQNMTDVLIPYTVASIEANAFDGCTLDYVYFTSIPNVASDVFTKNSKRETTLILNDKSYIAADPGAFPTLTLAPTYSRTMSNHWGTIVVPFDVKNSDKYCFYTLTSVSESELTITKVADDSTLPAGTPALVYMTDKALNAETGKYDLYLTAANTDINTAISTPAAIGGLALWGTYSAQDIAGENGYFISGGNFYSIAAQKAQNSSIKINLGAFRAYLAGKLSNGAAQLRISAEEATALEVLDSLSTGEGWGEAIYDLDGRRLDALREGVNIIKKGNKSVKIIVK